jgi:hypothetical protein
MATRRKRPWASRSAKARTFTPAGAVRRIRRSSATRGPAAGAVVSIFHHDEADPTKDKPPAPSEGLPAAAHKTGLPDALPEGL